MYFKCSEILIYLVYKNESRGNRMKHKFTKNNKYYTICVYALITTLIGAVGIKLILNWDNTTAFINNLLDVISPFLVGFLIAYIINPLSTFISQKILLKLFRIKPVSVRKVISILLSYVIVFGLIATIMFYIIPQIVDTLTQISSFIDTAQTGYNRVIKEIKAFDDRYPELDFTVVYNFINDIPSVISKFISESLPQIVPTLFSTAGSLISGVVDAAIAIIVSMYMLIDKHRLINNAKRATYAIFGNRRGDAIVTTAHECNNIFGDFIIGKMIDSLIIGCLCWLFMTFLSLPYALMISVIVGVTNMIPYFGPFIGAVPGAILLIIVDFKFAIIFVILIIILQQFDGLYLGPKILGESTGLRPIWIIFAITVGGWAAGVVGMFLGVPVVAVIAYLIDRLISNKIGKRKVVFETDPETGIMTRADMIVDETEHQE